MPRHRTISIARKELFELFDDVTANEGEKIVIGHRNSRKQALLVAKEYVDHLELANRRLQERVAREGFSLFGSATLHVPPAEVLRASRREQAQRSDAKRRRLAARDHTG